MTRLKLRWKLGAILVIAILAYIFGLVRGASADVPLTIYMATTGVDTDDGSIGSPVKTLERVESIISTTNPATDVEVRITQGVYVAGQTTWNTFISGHTITFMPVDYQYGMNSSQFAGRPIFRGNGTAGWWFYAQPSSSGTTGLRFYYLQAELYQDGGLMIRGQYATVDGVRVPTTQANGNTIYGMNFRKLGSKYVSAGGYGFAGIDLVNSSNNLVRANHFNNLENLTPNESHIHGVYMAHGSNDNQLINNEFTYISADGIRTRNVSSRNESYGNTLIHVGVHGFTVDWFCDGTCVTGTSVQECAGQDNTFHDNYILSGYTSTTIPTTYLVPASNTYSGPLPCIPITGNRLTATNNSTSPAFLKRTP